MFGISETDRQSIFIAIISGGRPRLSERPTSKLINALEDSGFTNIAWVVAEHHAEQYESDGREIVTYPSEWSAEYARDHWMSTDPVPPAGGFHGAFTGREWACLEAERRGCSAVLQLDDNISTISFVEERGVGKPFAREHGGLALFLEFFIAFMKSTNARMVGAQLASIPEPQLKVTRPGFCYSLFLEKVGEGRENWFGPYEDDITHALQYGSRPDGATPLVVPLLMYTKESTSKSGMRKHYNGKRALQLQRIFPESARIGVRKTLSNGLGEPRIFHMMSTKAISNPLTITDKKLYNSIVLKLNSLMNEWGEKQKEYNKEKVRKRIEKSKENKQ